MLKDETAILAAIFLNKNTVKQLVTSSLTRHSPYVISSLEALTKKGYVFKHRTKGYIITDKGIRALSEYFPECLSLDNVVRTKLLRKQMGEASKAVKAIEELRHDYEIKVTSLMNH